MAKLALESAVRAGRYRRTTHPRTGQALCVYWDGKPGHMANVAPVATIAANNQKLAERINTNRPLDHWQDVEEWGKAPT